MPDQPEWVTVFRSADAESEREAEQWLERLLDEGLNAVLVDDDAAGVVSGTRELRVPAGQAARAEAIIGTPRPVEPGDTSHDLDMVPLSVETEMEALGIRSVLEASGIPCVVIGTSQIPSLPFEVQVPRARLEEARQVVEEARASGPAAAEDAEAQTE